MGVQSNPSHYRRDRHQRPVEEVTWHDCNRFLQRLCEREGLPEGTYRLPHEEEWEYACRAGTQTAFSFGDDPRRLVHFAWTREQGKGTVAVGRFRSNAWGLYGMHGNVWEWCGNSFYYYDTKVKDGIRKSLRGGNWALWAEDCRSASRSRYPPDSNGNLLGFRVLRQITADTLSTPAGDPE